MLLLLFVLEGNHDMNKRRKKEKVSLRNAVILQIMSSQMLKNESSHYFYSLTHYMRDNHELVRKNFCRLSLIFNKNKK